MSVIVIIVLVMLIASLFQYYNPNIDIVTEDTCYKVLLWYDYYEKDEIHRKYKVLLIIKRKKS